MCDDSKGLQPWRSLNIARHPQILLNPHPQRQNVVYFQYNFLYIKPPGRPGQWYIHIFLLFFEEGHEITPIIKEKSKKIH